MSFGCLINLGIEFTVCSLDIEPTPLDTPLRDSTTQRRINCGLIVSCLQKSLQTKQTLLTNKKEIIK